MRERKPIDPLVAARAMRKEREAHVKAAYRNGWRWGFFSAGIPVFMIFNFVWAIVEFTRPEETEKERGRGRFTGIAVAFVVWFTLIVVSVGGFFAYVAYQGYQASVQAEQARKAQQVRQEAMRKAEEEQRKRLEKVRLEREEEQRLLVEKGKRQREEERKQQQAVDAKRKAEFAKIERQMQWKEEARQAERKKRKKEQTDARLTAMEKKRTRFLVEKRATKQKNLAAAEKNKKGVKAATRKAYLPPAEAGIRARDVTYLDKLEKGVRIFIKAKNGKTISCTYLSKPNTWTLNVLLNGQEYPCRMRDVLEIRAESQIIYSDRGVRGSIVATPSTQKDNTPPQSDHRAKAMLNMALQFLNIHRMDKAKSYAMKIIGQFPKSKEAKEARAILMIPGK